MYQYMVRYTSRNINYVSYMQFLSDIVLTKLQKAKLAIQYMSTNKKYCSKYLTDKHFVK